MGKQINTNTDKPINYEKLRPDILKGLIEDRFIECKQNKTDMIRHLILDDEDKYIRQLTCEKRDNEYLIGIDVKDGDNLIKMGKLVEKSLSKWGFFCCERIYYFSKEKL